jgi:hypothetical protein
MKMSWARAGASKATFSIKPIRALAQRYIGTGAWWIDPYAGDNPLGIQFSNDINPETRATYHVDALDFCKAAVRDIALGYGVPFLGVVYDPPYSYRQVSEHYRMVGRKATSLDTSAQFYSRVMNAVCDHIAVGGYAISCGWNTNGFGVNRGFVPIELLVVRHGSHHNDTLVLVEQRASLSEDMP